MREEFALERTQEIAPLRQYQSPNAIEEIKKELVSLVSHELRTPLTSIKGSLGLILGGACGELPEDLRDMLSVAYANNDRMIKLVNDLLDLTKLESGQVEMKLEQVTLRDVVERCCDELSSLADQRGVIIVSAVTDDRPTVYADPEYLQRVIINLLSHAVMVSPPNERVVVSAEQRDGWVTVRVRDHGAGIAPEDQEHIFEKFHQLYSHPTERMSGTGLGLSICRAIIQQHGGKIGVESQPGQGSQFFFWLRAAEIPAIRQDNRPAMQMMVRGKTAWSRLPCHSIGERPPFILMVDDDPGLRKVVARIAEHSGFEVATAANGEEAIEKIRAFEPDLIILDILMPVLSGFGVVQTLKRQAETQTLPLLVLTTKNLSDIERAELMLGPTKFLTKSLVTVESLTTAITELLQQRGKTCKVLI